MRSVHAYNLLGYGIWLDCGVHFKSSTQNRFSIDWAYFVCIGQYKQVVVHSNICRGAFPFATISTIISRRASHFLVDSFDPSLQWIFNT